MSLIIIKGGIFHPVALMYLIIINHSWLLGYIDLPFLCLFKQKMIKEVIIIFIMKPVLLKL